MAQVLVLRPVHSGDVPLPAHIARAGPLL